MSETSQNKEKSHSLFSKVKHGLKYIIGIHDED